MQKGRYRIFWAYAIRPERREEFLAAYRDDGEWARFFARHPGHVATRLFRSETDSDTWLTVDIWRSRADYGAFRQAHARHYETLDKRCAALTRQETFLGEVED